jgi:protein-arginine deiminase
MDNMLEANEFAHDRIEYNIGIIKKETGLDDEEILRIPAVYYPDGWKCDGEGEPIEDDPEEGEDDEDEGNENEGDQERKRRQQKLGRRLKRKRASQMMRRDEYPEVVRRPSGMEYGLSTFYPASINGLVLPGNIVTSNPWGPVIDGVDILAKAIETSYGKVGMNLTFVDDWFSLRAGQGGVHCATNAWRDVGDAKWW